MLEVFASTPVFGWVGTGMLRGWGAGTLLGPEGSAGGWSFCPCSRRCGAEGGVRPYFENYTVDASILKKRTQIDFSILWLM